MGASVVGEALGVLEGDAGVVEDELGVLVGVAVGAIEGALLDDGAYRFESRMQFS